ncbi:unnamed protein product [Nezara viridula]|uniref:Uncharacterized protein n=1 Tax=Nezara viridula TaxID=85310 RepID=A0A9P0H4K1_NEZVI|nr:unnamed protein product [Nezara viridula]
MADSASPHSPVSSVPSACSVVGCILLLLVPKPSDLVLQKLHQPLVLELQLVNISFILLSCSSRFTYGKRKYQFPLYGSSKPSQIHQAYKDNKILGNVY